MEVWSNGTEKCLLSIPTHAVRPDLGQLARRSPHFQCIFGFPLASTQTTSIERQRIAVSTFLRLDFALKRTLSQKSTRRDPDSPLSIRPLIPGCCNKSLI